MRLLLVLLVTLWASAASAQSLQDLLQADPEAISDPSRRTVGEVLGRLVDSGLPEVPAFLQHWQAKEVVQRRSDGLFFVGEPDGDGHILHDVSNGAEAGRAGPREVEELKPNAGVRGVIGSALIRFQLSDPDPARRQAALDAIANDPAADQIEPLRASLTDESDPAILVRKERLADLLAARFGSDPAARIAAIEDLGSDIAVEARAVLNQILASTSRVADTIPEEANVARTLAPGSADLPREAAYVMLVEAGLAPPRVTEAEIRDALSAAIADGRVGDAPAATLGTDEARHAAYDAMAAARGLPPRVTEAEVDAALASHAFWQDYEETDPAVTAAAERALGTAESRVRLYQTADIVLDAVSLASIYFLAAIGLAITFGVMGVINMAHGEFIMMGAYTGYVVQTLVPDYTLSLVLALPLAFAVTFAAGVAMERLVIRHLAHRPLETLLATFGISIALQQIAKNIFGTQARPLTSPGWLDGAWIVNDVLGIAYIRIAIFVLALLFLALILVVLRRTRLGLEVRAVTQNPGMAASMGIDPDRIAMLTFGLGSGIAGIAGVAIGLYAKVTSEMGSDYIVQSFMTVVVGGVGNVWGTLAGAALIGVLQKWIEWFNPSNTLAAQTYMILFIIAFIQFRPRGIVAMKGRAAGA
ncbi:urea ABC transporter permease subunit UrtB [Rubellimicrobium aerolatum]|uniref:Urea ABC transporter permease subunit UrtB n=1 Tax=Rubellimicrobium aerolatum TaxID=490979 RepID=A0ABW0SFZ1_9RHOB|nr:urea ABC transporter permease subunit UrtB [Rubellimicrobium aerolatum]MBP1807266.1 urea transport system permease protein [Rubellimicrobium aerolatum]